MKITPILAALLLISSCRTTSQNFTQLTPSTSDVVVAYIYYACSPTSNSYLTSGTAGPEFRINGKFIGYLAPDSYVPLTLPQGTTKMELLPTWNIPFFPNLRFEFDLHGNGPRYFRFNLFSRDVSYDKTEFKSVIQEVDPVYGVREVADCQLNKASHKRAIESGLSY